MNPLPLDQAALTRGQRKLLVELGDSPLGAHFYSSGGSALAGFYLRHRVSRDLELFTRDDVPVETIRAFLATVPGLEVKSYQKRFDRRIFLVEIDGEALEVEFTKYDFGRLAPARPLAGALELDDSTDILANKIAALADRHDPKDEIDLYFMLNAPGAPSLGEAVRLAEKKFGIPGLRFLLQSRLLAVSPRHPPTTPPVDRVELAKRLAELVRELVAEDAEP